MDASIECVGAHLCPKHGNKTCRYRISWHDMDVTKTDPLTSCVVIAENIQGRTLELQTQQAESDFTCVGWQLVVFCWSCHYFFESGSVRMACWHGRFCKKSPPNAETYQVEYKKCFTNVIYIPSAEHQPHLRWGFRWKARSRGLRPCDRGFTLRLSIDVQAVSDQTIWCVCHRSGMYLLITLSPYRRGIFAAGCFGWCFGSLQGIRRIGSEKHLMI